jgi:hypothetical protein
MMMMTMRVVMVTLAVSILSGISASSHTTRTTSKSVSHNGGTVHLIHNTGNHSPEALCHSGLRALPSDNNDNNLRVGCDIYAKSASDMAAHIAANSESWPTLPDICYNITWQTASNLATKPSDVGAFGSCFAMNTDSEWRYIVSNGVPDHYVAPYCPGTPVNATASSYCLATDPICAFEGLYCATQSALGRPGATLQGDVWVTYHDAFQIPLTKDPTLSDLPRSMYSVAGVTGTSKTVAAAVGVALNGVPIFGIDSQLLLFLFSSI